MNGQQYIPRMRVEIHDAEWRIQRVDRSTDGGYLLGCTGLPELVRTKSARFLTKLEENIRILDPAKTELVDDLSDRFSAWAYILTKYLLLPCFQIMRTLRYLNSTFNIIPQQYFPMWTTNTSRGNP